MRLLKTSFALLLACGLASPAAMAQDIGSLSLEQPWARSSPPGVPNGAAFMTIHNTGAEADRLIRAESPVSERVELHTHLQENGVMRMREVEAIDLPAGAATELKPGGLHVMFMGLKEPLVAGQTIPLTLHFETAGSLALTLPVEAMGGMGGMGSMAPAPAPAQGGGQMQHMHGHR